MKNFISNFTQEKYIPWWAAASAALVALWMIFQSHGVINNDGILYIEAAKQFANHEWQKGFALYNWPAYTLLIALVNALTGLEFQASAHFISIIFFAFTAAGVVVLTKEVGGDRRTMVAAALLLCCSPYIVRSLLPMVIRDHGFLAFHIWSLVFFLRYYRNNSMKDAFSWGCTAILATLFRIEGIVYLAFLPLTILMSDSLTWKKRFELILKAQSLSLALGIALATVLFLSPAVSINDLGRLKDPMGFLQSVFFQLSQGLSNKAEIYGESVLGPFLQNFSLTGLLATLALVVLTKSAASAGWLQLAFVAFSQMLSESQTLRYKPVLKWLLFLGLANAVVVTFSVFVLSTRYLLPIAILILIAGAFGLAALLLSIKRKWILYGLCTAIALQLAATIWPFNSDHRYEIEAASWVENHIASDKKIYFDEDRLRYYAFGDSTGRAEKSWSEVRTFLNSDELQQFDYVLVHVSHRHPEQQEWIIQKLGVPIASFKNRRGKQIQIHDIP
jgi:hypothetical protein